MVEAITVLEVEKAPYYGTAGFEIVEIAMTQNPQPDQLEKILKNLLIQHADRLWNLKPPDIDLSKALAALRQREIDCRIDELENIFVDFDERKLRRINGTQLEKIDERIAQLKAAKDSK